MSAVDDAGRGDTGSQQPFADDAAPTIVEMNYLKSPQYRETGCDGVIGGLTPRGKVWIGFYTERLPVPRIVQHHLRHVEGTSFLEIDPDTPVVPVEGRRGIMRNLEYGLYLDPGTAKELHEWLGKQLEILGKDQP